MMKFLEQARLSKPPVSSLHRYPAAETIRFDVGILAQHVVIILRSPSDVQLERMKAPFCLHQVDILVAIYSGHRTSNLGPNKSGPYGKHPCRRKRRREEQWPGGDTNTLSAHTKIFGNHVCSFRAVSKDRTWVAFENISQLRTSRQTHVVR